MFAVLLTFQQVAAGVGEPSVSTVAVAFAGICALWLANAVIKGRDAQLRLIARVEQLVARVDGVDATLVEHCNDERAFWDSDRASLHKEVSDTATRVLSEAQMHMEEVMLRRFDLLAQELRAIVAPKGKGR